MVKKVMAFAVAAFLLVGLASCGKQPVQANSEASSSNAAAATEKSSTDISLENKDELQQKFLENNSIKTLLENNKCITYSQIDKVNGDVCCISYYKNDSGEYIGTEMWNDFATYETESFYLAYSSEVKTMSVDAQEEPHENISDNNLYHINENEEIVSITENADGDIEIKEKSKLNADDAESYSEMWDTHEGDYFVSVSVFDKDTYRLKESTFQLLCSDTGDIKDVAVAAICILDKQKTPLVLKDILSLPTHKLTLNLASGEVREFNIPEGFAGDIVIDEGRNLYTDKDGKIPYELTDEPLTTDLELFVI